MGCGFSDESWQEEMERLELELFKDGGADLSKLTRKFTIITVEGKKLAVRTCIYNDDKSKKTLVITHGFGCNGAMTAFKILVPLAEHYRIVIFDNGGWGLNTKVKKEETQALASPEASENYIVEWYKAAIDAMTEAGDIP
jgi:pimeloyl-ACP methyl ester carboxylesterase